jgi:ubiquinone/menaquinone biosynthesis C-methylase UbiE
MSTTEEKLAKSLTAETVEIIPYLPYLLQDLWELGSSPKDMIQLISRNIIVSENSKVLDLGCGKGAVSVNIAKQFGCRVKGIDLMPQFIEEANIKAKHYEVEELCEFVVGDMNHSVEFEKGFDIVILGAVGDVLGNQEETLQKLSSTVKNNGYVLLDDAYARNESDVFYMTKEKWLEIIENSGFQWVADWPVNETELTEVLKEQIRCLTRRTSELKEKNPAQAYLFDQYMKNQLNECEELENDILGVTMLLKRIY